MNKWLLITALPLLGACADPNSLSRLNAAHSLDVTWLGANNMQIELDNQRYAGASTSSPCFTDACRGVYRNVSRLHRSHIQQGQAELVSPTGSRMACEWVSHLPELHGVCTTEDGRRFLLVDQGAKPHQPADTP
jgi:hypothetical protein